jgi:hypothetical protein
MNDAAFAAQYYYKIVTLAYQEGRFGGVHPPPEIIPKF